MDLILLVGIAVALLVVLITLYFLKSKDQTKAAQPEPQRNAEGGRRAQVARNQRNRVVRAARQENPEDDDESELPTNIPEFDEKMGAKKRAKLEQKAEKKNQREAELKMREEQKQKDELADLERKKMDEKENEAERIIEEAAKKAQEEKERQEYEEYLKLKQEFSVQEEGFDEEEDETDSLLQNFIDYIKTNKVVILEDLAAQFKLKTQAAIDRIIELQKEGRLSGVIDDRGKFIFISEEELAAVAKFIRQRGRVSIAELAENSNQLINLAG